MFLDLEGAGKPVFDAWRVLIIRGAVLDFRPGERYLSLGFASV